MSHISQSKLPLQESGHCSSLMHPDSTGRQRHQRPSDLVVSLEISSIRVTALRWRGRSVEQSDRHMLCHLADLTVPTASTALLLCRTRGAFAARSTDSACLS